MPTEWRTPTQQEIEDLLYDIAADVREVISRPAIHGSQQFMDFLNGRMCAVRVLGFLSREQVEDARRAMRGETSSPWWEEWKPPSEQE